VIETLLQYLHTDSACCRDEPGPLAARQSQVPPRARIACACVPLPRMGSLRSCMHLATAAGLPVTAILLLLGRSMVWLLNGDSMQSAGAV